LPVLSRFRALISVGIPDPDAVRMTRTGSSPPATWPAATPTQMLVTALAA